VYIDIYLGCGVTRCGAGENIRDVGVIVQQHGGLDENIRTREHREVGVRVT